MSGSLTADERKRMLDDLVALSESLLDDAKAGRWDAVAKHQAVRRTLIDRLLACGSARADRAAFDTVIRLDEALRTLAREQLERIANESREHRGLRSASARYGEVHRMRRAS